MSLLKSCKYHGNLLQNQITLVKNRRGTFDKICTLCRRERIKKSYQKNIAKHKLRKKNDYQKNKEKYIEYSRQYRLNNKEKVKLSRQLYGIKNKDRVKNQILKQKFNIRIDQYKNMFSSQNGLCKICQQPETIKARNCDYIKALSVDHCHKTGKIRGLLCDRCNKGIGYLKDSIELLQNAIRYLKEYSIK